MGDVEKEGRAIRKERRGGAGEAGVDLKAAHRGEGRIVKWKK